MAIPYKDTHDPLVTHLSFGSQSDPDKRITFESSAYVVNASVKVSLGSCSVLLTREELAAIYAVFSPPPRR